MRNRGPLKSSTCNSLVLVGFACVTMFNCPVAENPFAKVTSSYALEFPTQHRTSLANDVTTVASNWPGVTDTLDASTLLYDLKALM